MPIQENCPELPSPRMRQVWPFLSSACSCSGSDRTNICTTGASGNCMSCAVKAVPVFSYIYGCNFVYIRSVVTHRLAPPIYTLYIQRDLLKMGAVILLHYFVQKKGPLTGAPAKCKRVKVQRVTSSWQDGTPRRCCGRRVRRGCDSLPGSTAGC